MTTVIAAFTAAHPYWSGIGLWLLFNLIATGLWSLCKVRSSEDDEEPIVLAPPRQSSYTPPAAPGLLSERRKVS